MPYKDLEQKRAYQREWAARRRQAFMHDKSCVWCGSTENLELHHRDPSEKTSHKIWTWSERRREDEIAKCIVVCRSCHATAHAESRSIEAGLRNPHGTIWTYWRGCRCSPCRAARAEYGRAQRAA